MTDSPASPRDILICSCDQTMPLSPDGIRRGCRHEISSSVQLCGREIDRFTSVASKDTPLTVACTQQAALFTDIAAEMGRTNPILFANVRELAGWSSEGERAAPKMAALLAAAAETTSEPETVDFESRGAILIYGRDERAIEAAYLLKDHLDVTVLITPPAEVALPRKVDFPTAKGKIRSVRGHLGSFELVVDEFAESTPSSRGTLNFGSTRGNVRSTCDIILDLTGSVALFPAGNLREGYLREDPGDPAATLRAVMKARDLVGTFRKPRYISFEAKLCAHSRSQRPGCTRCLDLCPAGAITPSGNHVSIDPHICAGCGQCAAACPTGAASYALPPADELVRRLRAMMVAYRDAGGTHPMLLMHDDLHGTSLIECLSRFGDGLPAHVLPFAVNESTQVGLETIAAAFAYGASRLQFLLPSEQRHDTTGLRQTIALAGSILAGLGFGPDRVSTIETDDPDSLLDALRVVAPHPGVPRPASFRPIGTKRDVLRFALAELHRAAPKPIDIVALPPGAPLGAVEIDDASCTLCLSCVSVCPTHALRDDPERPVLRFVEDACVQCGLCQATCPERAVTLIPRVNFGAANSPARVLKEEEPFCCIRCNKPFGVRSTIERMISKLCGRHWMYAPSARRLDAVQMCGDCRVIFAAEQGFEASGKVAPLVRTTDDYHREQAATSFAETKSGGGGP